MSGSAGVRLSLSPALRPRIQRAGGTPPPAGPATPTGGSGDGQRSRYTDFALVRSLVSLILDVLADKCELRRLEPMTRRAPREKISARLQMHRAARLSPARTAPYWMSEPLVGRTLIQERTPGVLEAVVLCHAREGRVRACALRLVRSGRALTLTEIEFG